jgi:UDP-GlcNAc:undecaprenyl-phosphate GlcNAc-1-phosphate transferase
MGAEPAAVLGFAAAAAVTAGATPLAIAVADRTGFYDHPREYRQHGSPTPFLGGAAVLIGVLIASLCVHAVPGRLLVLLACAVGVSLVGTIDDRIALAPRWRLLADTLAATALLAAGLGWKTTGGPVVDFALTVLWVVGLVNAFNLMDNLDGACGSVGAVCAGGIGILALIHGQSVVAVIALALAGACTGFLPWNLAAPARIFLGDGGSMPIGFLVAALAMAAGRGLHVGDANVLVGALLAAVPVLDTGLVTISRLRRGVPIVTGGRDHLTHRLLPALRSPRTVAAALALAQAALCALAIGGAGLGTAAVVTLALATATIGAFTIMVLDMPRWRPAGIAVGTTSLAGQTAAPSSVGIDSG